jgi:phosphoglycolate phosphatase-like HAD superfamily hydrolase
VPPLISFDIDGTLEIGDPPGLISVEMLRQVKRLGYLIGSCSDRPVSYQQRMWRRLEIAADFTVLKHRLADVRIQFLAERYYHIGDTDVDHLFASKAGFQFFRADAAVLDAWGPELFI